MWKGYVPLGLCVGRGGVVCSVPRRAGCSTKNKQEGRSADNNGRREEQSEGCERRSGVSARARRGRGTAARAYVISDNDLGRARDQRDGLL